MKLLAAVSVSCSRASQLFSAEGPCDNPRFSCTAHASSPTAAQPHVGAPEQPSAQLAPPPTSTVVRNLPTPAKSDKPKQASPCSTALYKRWPCRKPGWAIFPCRKTIPLPVGMRGMAPRMAATASAIRSRTCNGRPRLLLRGRRPHLNTVCANHRRLASGLNPPQSSNFRRPMGDQWCCCF